jgi:hypothetical protein
MDCPACESAKGIKYSSELRTHLLESHHMDYSVALSIAILVERVEKLEKKQTS